MMTFQERSFSNGESHRGGSSPGGEVLSRHEIIADASHELKTPLSIISGYLENFCESKQPGDWKQARRIFQIMQRNVMRMDRVVDHMLFVSRLETGAENLLNFEVLNLALSVNEVLETLQSQFEKHESSVKSSLNNIQFNGDRFCWNLALLYLLEHVIEQVCKERHIILFEAFPVDSGDFVLRVSSSEAFAIQPFHQGEFSLLIIESALRAHGGKLFFSSDEKQGSWYEIRMPQV